MRANRRSGTSLALLAACCSLGIFVAGPALYGQERSAPSLVDTPALVDAPLVDAPSAVELAQNIQQQARMQAQVTVATPGSGATSASGQARTLTRQQAEQIAIQNNPRISAAKLVALAQHQVYRQTRSQYLPQFNGGMVAEEANSGSRYSVDGLRTTRLLTHAGGGISMQQLITDFGRTSNLIASSGLNEKAQNANAMATRMDIVLATDQVFYSALESAALVKTAQQTLKTRQATEDLIAELTKNKLRSDIDLAFADQNQAEAKLLLLDAQDQYQRDLDALSALLGQDHPVHYELVDDSAAPPLPPPDVDALVKLALQQRPDLLALDYSQQAAGKFSRAQHEQWLPTINTTGVFGGTPVRDDTYFTGNWFGAVGVNLSVPLFNGFLYSAEASEASDRARASKEQWRDLRNNVVRDVNDAWLETNTAYQKIGVTEKLVQAANLGLDLGQARYKLGLSSIVELSQSQLQQTQAAIQNINARYAYELSLAALNYQIGNMP